MSAEDMVARNLVAALEKHLVCSAGGSRAILAGAGTIQACKIAGIDLSQEAIKWKTIGGISGGSLPALLLAAGYPPEELMQIAIGVDFSTLVPRHATPLHTIIAFLLKDRFEYTRPKKGVLDSEPLGRFVEDKVKVWPKNFWTMAVVGRTQILFTAQGVFQYLPNGERRILSTEPAPIGIAIRATCAVPGIIDAAPFMGRYLVDGALSWDGSCPVGITMRHFGASPEQIIACEVGDEHHRFANTFRWFWSLVCGGHCVDHTGPKVEIPPQVVLMKPNIWSVRSLQFNLTIEQKWQAVMSGFQEAVIKLTRAGLLSGDRQKQAFSICMDVEKLKALAHK